MVCLAPGFIIEDEAYLTLLAFEISCIDGFSEVCYGIGSEGDELKSAEIGFLYAKRATLQSAVFRAVSQKDEASLGCGGEDE